MTGLFPRNRFALVLLAAILPVSTALAADLGPLVRDRLAATGSVEVRRFYASRGFEPAWSARDRAIAAEALSKADEEGLAAADYSLAPDRDPASPQSAARADIELSAKILRYAGDLRTGRIAPRAVYDDVDLPAQPFDPAAALEAALESGSLTAFLADLAPQQPEYTFLRTALAQYRELAAKGGWPTLAPMKGLVEDLSADEQQSLRHRLEIETQLPPTQGDPPHELEAALRAFQARNGLEIDGKLGPRTLQALNIPASYRVLQIEANMERWRWLPHRLESRYIAVNTADASLVAMDKGVAVLTSRVVVGKPKTPTPMLSATVLAVTVNPPWNVPASIAAKEILPKLRRNAAYLANQDMILRNGPAGDPHGLTIRWQNVSRARFPYQVQQLSGEKNALGQLKLEMPNRFDVYLHDTPAKTLFAQPARYFSHGCMRVQQIGALAKYALTGDPQADVARLIRPDQKTDRLPLEKPLQVYVLYWTAFRDGDGAIAFRNDIYGRDTRLIAALSGRRVAAAAAPQIGCSA